MFTIDTDQTIHITRGDTGVIVISANKSENEPYIFQQGDVVRFKVFLRKQPDSVVLEKDTPVSEKTTTVDIVLSQADTKIGDFINRPTDYWYEIELNPDVAPQTIIGYDDKGPKIFRVYPEGGELA